MSRATWWALGLSSVLWAGCSHAPPAPPPPVAPELPAGSPDIAPLPVDWWTGFGDPGLNALVTEVLAHNRELDRAGARIDEARAALQLAQGQRQPVVSAGLAATRQRSSETGAVPVGPTPVSTDLRATLNVAYEADLWGRAAAGTRAARDELAAGEFNRAALRTTLAAQVVKTLAALRGAEAQIALIEQVVQGQRDGLRLQRLRFEGGDLSELDLRQLEAELANNEGQLPRLQRARAETERALAVLLGRSPKAMLEQTVAPGGAPLALTGGVPAGLPSALLQQRPDVAAAQARLRAAGARVEVARAAYLPTVALSASLGKASSELRHLFDAPSTIWSLVASLTQPIWNGGRLDAGLSLSQAQQRQAELDYRDAVAQAFREARDALDGVDEVGRSLALGQLRSNALERAAELTRLRAEGGVASRLDAIEAERAALNARVQLADQRRALAAVQADLFRALGGGWVPGEAGAAPSSPAPAGRTGG